MTIKLQAVTSAVPDTLWTNRKIQELTGASPDFVEKKIGVESRFFLGDNETGVDLSLEAVSKLLDQCNIDKNAIELLVYITQTPDYRIPQNSALLHQRLKLPKSCASFDISLGCSGYVYGLSVTQGLMEIQGISNAILVTCDPYSKIMDKNDKNTMTVFGDAATASLLSNEGVFQIGKADMGTNGEFSSSLQIDHAGAKNPVLGVHRELPRTSKVEEIRLNMKGREVFNFVVSNVPNSIQNCLNKNNLEMEDVTWFALHQGSKHMLDYMASRVGIPDEKMLRNLSKYGNTVSSTVPMLIEELLDNSSLIGGNKVIISGFGVGLSWATNVLTFKPQQYK